MAKKDSNGNPLGKSRGLGKRGASTADFASWDAEKLKRAIVTAASTGGAIRFGYTSDGGAYALGIYGDGAPYTHYVKPDDESGDILDDICDLFESIRDDGKQAT